MRDLAEQFCTACEKARATQAERDRFTASCAAMTGMLANTDHDGSASAFAEDAVKWADALLAELSKEPKP